MNVLQKYRGDRHITQTELAQQLGCSQSHIANLEAGRKAPSTGFLQKLQQSDSTYFTAVVIMRLVNSRPTNMR